MSRSRRKPYITDQQHGSTKLIKRKASRKIRNLPKTESPQNGKSYKKYFESWNIRDWVWYSPKNPKAYRK